MYGAGSSLYGGTITINARKVKSKSGHVFDPGSVLCQVPGVVFTSGLVGFCQRVDQ